MIDHVGKCSKCGENGARITYRWTSLDKCLCVKCDMDRKRELNNARQSVYNAQKRAKAQLSPPDKPYSFKNKRSTVKRVPIAKKATRRLVSKQGKDAVLNKEIWHHRKHCCYECLKPLEFPGFPPKWVFSHVHGKGSRPDLRHLKANVVFHCFCCHQEWETGGKRDEKTPRTLQLFEKISVKYPDNRNGR